MAALSEGDEKQPEESKTSLSSSVQHKNWFFHSWSMPSFTKRTNMKLDRGMDVKQHNTLGSDGDISLGKGESKKAVGDILFTGYCSCFDYSVFIKELTIHVLYPLFVWVDPCMHSFSSFEGEALIAIHILPASIMLAIILGHFYNVFDETIILPIFLYVLHKIFVSVKYASLHPKEYEKLRRGSEEEVKRYQRQLQMVTFYWGITFRFLSFASFLAS